MNIRQFHEILQIGSIRCPSCSELTHDLIRYPVGDDFQHSFYHQLSWSHYWALMRALEIDARNFYEQEASECGWTEAQLERQIQSSYYQRIIANRGFAFQNKILTVRKVISYNSASRPAND